jgi:hypothetical protein
VEESTKFQALREGELKVAREKFSSNLNSIDFHEKELSDIGEINIEPEVVIFSECVEQVTTEGVMIENKPIELIMNEPDEISMTEPQFDDQIDDPPFMADTPTKKPEIVKIF